MTDRGARWNRQPRSDGIIADRRTRTGDRIAAQSVPWWDGALELLIPVPDHDGENDRGYQ